MKSIKRLLGLGDNVLDHYLYQKKMYPGGNALNVAVLSHKFGINSSYLGVLGNDKGGRHLLEVLKKEGIEISHIRVENGNNSYSKITLIDNDRVFMGSDLALSATLKLNKDDFDYIKNFDIIHTSIYSNLENELKKIKENGSKISFDFSDEFDNNYIEKVLPYIEYAFFSGSQMSEENIYKLLDKSEKNGVLLSIVTKGKEGAFCKVNGKIYRQNIFPVESVIDTLGAGDAFIARVLAGIITQEEVEVFLKEAAKEAANNCTWYGAFGYGVSI
ncbi:PfkB family carbohydrate kinase [Fusobacterium necrophorum]|uniref:PfkB family carbohydrate kinase n=1 Tax=Fusobacterium necrophorum TaxID=859 RepID=UPI000460E29D|nr:PfkB family carbohydrate kinase [Fusobacterium necrophorum]KDE63610.1 hypothetical protein FUSO5_07610 [Fusobacterium necrophorum BFTR-1]KDE65549.1 hypothetical protein FUSO4_06405 [Fusobacterium necrophorum DJ-1]KDE74838.1 fructosamine kinase [Fusobacterium necrophorum BFTR-2]